MALENHLRAAILIEGSYQVTVTSITINADSGAQRVDTLEGLAGKTDGAKSLEISVNATVPTGGPEFDFLKGIFDGSVFNVQVPIGAKSLVTTGWVQNGSFSGSVGANTEVSFTFMCEFTEPQ